MWVLCRRLFWSIVEILFGVLDVGALPTFVFVDRGDTLWGFRCVANAAAVVPLVVAGDPSEGGFGVGLGSDDVGDGAARRRFGRVFGGFLWLYPGRKRQW
ncbi:hypothetical protein F0562_005510 [Nyssa sinensis]|uniref:Uncharacterized protein n=1 Tax=Nyssa sinensis TaxID=561372 RepID=A0A5J5AMH0_9ASTE|nr:hypothetical protein F0562_005510 [Nyssa sinensis]